MRRAGGVHWMPGARGLRGSWMLTRYDDVSQVLRARETSKLPRPDAVRRCPYDHCLSTQDAPDHGRIKATLLPHFSAQRAAALAPVIERVVNTLLAPILAQGGADFVEAFAAPLPARVLAHLLGIPDVLYMRFVDWSCTVLTGHDMSNRSDSSRAEALMGLTLIARTLVGRRRSLAADDLVGTMLRACEEGGELSEDELVGTLIQLMVVGHETTANLLANGLWLLLRHDDAYGRVAREPQRLPRAIDEMLRYESPVQRLALRTLTAPLTLSGVRLEAGDHVTVVIGSANRDPQQFDDPDLFNIEREPNRHLAFGAGAHACLAHSLARLQARIAFETIVARAAGLQLADPRPHWRLASGSVRGLQRLRVVTR
jgi:cytochrome P450